MSYNRTPRDFHNDNAVEDIDVAQIERTAFEKGRMQGEMEATRRLEAESGVLQNKTFQDTTIIQQNGAYNNVDVVEINSLTNTQWLAALVGELCGIAYIILMGVWIDQYRTGTVDWSNSDKNGNRGMFNVHVLVSFIGLWFASQAYITYRILPLSMSPGLNKIWYLICHVCALGAFALAVACATMSAPNTRAWSMHAWTAYLAVFIYALHAFYSCMKVLFTRHGVSSTNWNETNRHANVINPNNNTGVITDAPAGTTSSAEQVRDNEFRPNVMYRAGPSAGIWKRTDREAAIDVDARNANLGSSQPVWSESTLYEAQQFFLVPRAKWAVMSLMCLMASCLMGLAEWQVLLSTGVLNWPQARGQDTQGNFNGIGFRSDEAVIIGVLGLVTLLGTVLIGYAALPPRTTLTKAGGGIPATQQVIQNRRASVSTAGTTAPNTRLGQEIEVV